jgi:hypothetical protein
MNGLTVAPSVHRRWTTLLLRTAIVGLTLATAVIHWSLGGLLFTLNAIGYMTLALALVLPGPFGRIRPLVRLGLIGFTVATIVGWYLFGARFDLAYIDKAIEVVLVALASVDLWRSDGGPLALARRGTALLTSLWVGPR